MAWWAWWARGVPNTRRIDPLIRWYIHWSADAHIVRDRLIHLCIDPLNHHQAKPEVSKLMEMLREQVDHTLEMRVRANPVGGEGDGGGDGGGLPIEVLRAEDIIITTINKLLLSEE